MTVEPSTRECERLTATIELNRRDNVKPFKVALGSRVGNALLAVAHARNAGMNVIDPQDSTRSAAAWTESKEPLCWSRSTRSSPDPK